MRGKSRGFKIVGAGLVLALPLVFAPSADAGTGLPNVPIQLKVVKGHLSELQKIADANGGTRVAGSAGHDASADYVAAKLKKAGYTVTLQPFDFNFFEELSDPVMNRTAPTSTTYATPADFATMTYSGSGNVTATVQGVDLVLPPGPIPSTSNSGCEAGDFAGFTAGNIALLQRGTCTFEDKAANAQAAGAVGVIIFNEGQPGRTDTLQGTLGAPKTIPVVGTSFALGNEFAATPGTVVHLQTDTISEVRTTNNVIADSKYGDPAKTVMVGAHLDSVPAGPGINDNGSGSAAILAVAEQLGHKQTPNHLRFAWWSAEEENLVGSTFYVDSLSADQLGAIKMYLNFDMVASPNYAMKIYDGDDSDAAGAGPGPAGSGQIEDAFEAWYDAKKVGHVGTDFDGRSDYGPFIASGVPAGGLFTGAEGIKTPAEATLFGGTAGAAYDACYHQACDTTANINDKALSLNSDAIASVTSFFAFATVLPG